MPDRFKRLSNTKYALKLCCQRFLDLGTPQALGHVKAAAVVNAADGRAATVAWHLFRVDALQRAGFLCARTGRPAFEHKASRDNMAGVPSPCKAAAEAAAAATKGTAAKGEAKVSGPPTAASATGPVAPPSCPETHVDRAQAHLFEWARRRVAAYTPRLRAAGVPVAALDGAAAVDWGAVGDELAARPGGVGVTAAATGEWRHRGMFLLVLLSSTALHGDDRVDWSLPSLQSGAELGKAGLYTHAVHAALRAGARLFFRVWEDYASSGVRGTNDDDEGVGAEEEAERKRYAARRDQWRLFHEDHNAKAFMAYVAAVGELAQQGQGQPADRKAPAHATRRRGGMSG